MLDWEDLDRDGILSPSVRARIDEAVEDRVTDAIMRVHLDMQRPTLESPVGPETYTWVYFDYLDGKLGMRVEPKNPLLAEAIKGLIPKEERLYISNRRTWVFPPVYAKAVMKALEHFCADYPLMVEAENQGVIMQLLLGPANVPINRSAQPGVHLGNIGGR